MSCYLLTVTETIGCPLVYICMSVSFRNLSSLDFRSSFKNFSLTCDNFISNQKFVLFIWILDSSCFFLFFKEVLNCLLAGKSSDFDFPVFLSCSHHCCFQKSSLWTIALLSSDIQSLPQGVLGPSISKRQQMNAAIWSICKWDNIDQHDKHAVTLKLYVNLFYSLQTTSSHSHFKSSTEYMYFMVTAAIIVIKRLIKNLQAVKNNLHCKRKIRCCRCLQKYILLTVHCTVVYT